MNLYLLLLKSLLKKDIYTKYYNYINLEHIDKNYPDLYRLYVVLPELHKNPKDYTLDDLYLGLLTLYPKIDENFYQLLFNQLSGMDVDESSITGYLKRLQEREEALSLAKTALKVAEGQGDFAELRGKFEALETGGTSNQNWESNFTSNSLAQLHKELSVDQGLRWRLPSLNNALGSLRKGDFGFLFARPETGKTTFLASEITHMAGQTDRPIIWFNNEEQGNKVMYRCYQAALGLTLPQLDADISGNEKRFMTEFSNIEIYNEASISKQRVEEVCAARQPALIIFDQIDKLKGFQADRHDLELKETYQWAREVAKRYGPVIGVCQAGASGEDKKWLTMNDVDSSKTAKQGEADWILGIGKIHEPGSEYLRFMHLSKNKLHGDKDSDPQMRHGRWQVFIKPEVARYTEIGAG